MKQVASVALRFFPGILLIANVATKLPWLTAEDIGLDEPFTIYHAQFPAAVIVEQLKAYNNPPLYEIILHYWTMLFGISPLAVRLLPMLIACLCPVALYYFTRRNFAERIAVVSSLLLTFNYLLLYYAHDCRVYTLFVLLTILSMHCYLVACENLSVRSRSTLIYIAVTALLIYAHYFGFFVIFIQLVHILLFHRRVLWKFCLVVLGVVVFYLPHIWSFIFRMGDSVSRGTWVDPPRGIEGLYNTLWVYSNFPFVTVGCIALLCIAFVKWLLKKPRVSASAAWLIITWFLFVWLGMYIISFFVPMYINRYLIYGLPAYHILVALAIDFIFDKKQPRLFAFASVIFCFAFTLDLSPAKKRPVQKAVGMIMQNKTAATSVIVQPFDLLPEISYYYDRSAFANKSDHREYRYLDSAMRAQGMYFLRTAENLRECRYQLHDSILYLAAGDDKNSPSNEIFRWLSDSLQLQWRKPLGDHWYVTLFVSPPRR